MNMINIREYTAPTDLLKDRVILVTGAGGSIGSTVARSYAAHGATVLLLGRSKSRLEKIYDAIMDAGHPQPVMIPFDLEKAPPKDYETVAKAIDEQFGRLNGLLHAAATLGALTPLSHYDPVLWSRVMQTDLNAPFLLTRTCLDVMNKSDTASVIFTVDEIGQKGKAYWGAYSVAQAALRNLAEIFADELETNTSIRVNTFTPGPVRSRLRALAYPGEDPNSLPSPEILTPYFLYLMGNGSADTSGQHISMLNNA